METVADYFGSNVFDDRTQKAMLSTDVYQSLRRTIDEGAPLEEKVANAVALAMKDWALEKGVTHYTHWFQPLTSVTAEKHDSFIEPSPDGRVIMEFTGKNLVQAEPDASSFPSGGLRETCSARGYSVWDPTSYAFVKEKTLYIPAAFCSYTGEILDQKAPLLRSMEALSTQAKRILKLFGKNVKCVKTSVGPEQEYFLVDEEMFKARPDLVFSGRTLFGAPAPKGQELDDQYFGILPARVKEFMEDLDRELWSVGILSKTEHNEVAPAQHEMAPIYNMTNIAVDGNNMSMEIMQKVARRHGLVCLLHEKPFDGVNGSGKHNNWSMATDEGENLLSPGHDPFHTPQFMLVLTSVIEAVDTYQDLLRVSVASAGNDHRLGANEAPPAVISVYLGDELNRVVEHAMSGEEYEGHHKQSMDLGVTVLPKLKQDTTDRNRTSPFAFTGNKFEFRMVGSTANIADVNTMLNAAVAEVMKRYADELESASDLDAAIKTLVQRQLNAHKRIIFNGNGYTDEWIEEAARRGLSNYKTTPDAIPHLVDEENVKMLTDLKIFTDVELKARCTIKLEEYTKKVLIEAKTMVEMANQDILPAIENYEEELLSLAAKKQSLNRNVGAYETGLLDDLGEKVDEIYTAKCALAAKIEKVSAEVDAKAAAELVRDEILPAMDALRAPVDAAEVVMPKMEWPYPSYGDLLFGVDT